MNLQHDLAKKLQKSDSDEIFETFLACGVRMAFGSGDRVATMAEDQVQCAFVGVKSGSYNLSKVRTCFWLFSGTQGSGSVFIAPSTPAQLELHVFLPLGKHKL